MPCLRSLDLSTFSDPESPSQSSTHKNIVPLLKLTRFRYDGHSVLLSALVAGLSAPSPGSPQDVRPFQRRPGIPSKRGLVTDIAPVGGQFQIYTLYFTQMPPFRLVSFDLALPYLHPPVLCLCSALRSQVGTCLSLVSDKS
jgi:hypothetical protein